MYLKINKYKTADSKKKCINIIINDLKTMKSSSCREKRLLQITVTDPSQVMNCVRNPIISSNLTDRASRSMLSIILFLNLDCFILKLDTCITVYIISTVTLHFSVTNAVILFKE